MEKKFEEIIVSFINGNISWVKEQIKKLSKENRKCLYQYHKEKYFDSDADAFFFDLI